MKKIILLVVFLFFSSTAFMFSTPPCTDCMFGTFTLTSMTVPIATCPGCSVTVYYWSNPACKEIIIGHFTDANYECSLCGYSNIFNFVATYLLEYGPFAPPSGGTTVQTRLNSFACFREVPTVSNGYDLLPCNNTVCCKSVYEVTDLGGGLFDIVQLSLELTPPGSLCYDPCFTVCSMGYYPKVPVIHDSKSTNHDNGLGVNFCNLVKKDGLNYLFVFKPSDGGILKIKFHDYIGNLLYSLDKQVNQDEIIQENLNLSSLNGLVFYTISLNGNLIKEDKLFIEK